MRRVWGMYAGLRSVAGSSLSVGCWVYDMGVRQAHAQLHTWFTLVLCASWCVQPSRQMCAAAAARGVQLLLPCDVLVSPSLEGPPQPNTNTSSSLSSGACGAGSSCCASSCIGSGPGPAGHCAEGATGTAKEGCAGGLHVVELIVGCCTDDAPCVPPGGLPAPHHIAQPSATCTLLGNSLFMVDH